MPYCKVALTWSPCGVVFEANVVSIFNFMYLMHFATYTPKLQANKLIKQAVV